MKAFDEVRERKTGTLYCIVDDDLHTPDGRLLYALENLDDDEQIFSLKFEDELNNEFVPAEEYKE